MNNFDHSLEEESTKIYKRPTVFTNIIKKVKSLGKLKTPQDLNLNSSRVTKKINLNQSSKEKMNTNSMSNKNSYKNINAYIKKNPKIHLIKII